MAVRPTEQARFTSPFSPSGQEGFYGDSDGQIASTCSGPCNSGHYCPEGSTIPDPPDCLPQYFLMYYNDSGVNKPMCRPCNGTLVGPDGAKSWSGSAALDGEAHLYGADSEAGGGSDLTGLTKCWNYTTLPTHITLETLPLQDNFWRQHNWSFKILPCLAENVCIGADPEGLPFHCREGHEGPFCTVLS